MEIESPEIFTGSTGKTYTRSITDACFGLRFKLLSIPMIVYVVVQRPFCVFFKLPRR